MMKLRVCVCKVCATACYVVFEGYPGEEPLQCPFLVDGSEFKPITKEELVETLKLEELP